MTLSYLSHVCPGPFYELARNLDQSREEQKEFYIRDRDPGTGDYREGTGPHHSSFAEVEPGCWSGHVKRRSAATGASQQTSRVAALW